MININEDALSLKIWKDKRVKLVVAVNNTRLFYTALILDSNDINITFRDIKDNTYTFNWANIEQISEDLNYKEEDLR